MGNSNTVTVDVTCSGCKRLIKGITRPKNEKIPYVCPNCNNCADNYNKTEKKGAVCSGCGEVKLVPKDTVIDERGFLCNECAAMRRNVHQMQITSGRSSSDSRFLEIKN